MGFGDPFLLFLILKKDEEQLLVVGGSFFSSKKFLSAGQSAVVRGQHEIWNFVGKFVTSRMLIKKKHGSCLSPTTIRPTQYKINNLVLKPNHPDYA